MESKQLILNGHPDPPRPTQSYTSFRNHYLTLRETFMKNLSSSPSIDSELRNCTTNEQKLSVIQKYFEWNEISGATSIPELTKSEANSQRFREIGNQAYKSRKYSDAMKYYNLALMFGPNRSKEVVLAYSNLSALFMEIKEFGAALQSMNFALQYLEILEMPELECKLKNRKLKCQEEKPVAEEYTNISPFPVKLKCPNENPKLSSAAESFVNIESDPKSGRKLIVTREVDTGTTLLIEKPFSVTLDKELEWDASHCHNCYDTILTGIPCDQCPFAIYCSENCFKESKNSSHKYECQILPYFHINSTNGSPFISERSLLALRIVCKVGPADINAKFHQFDSDYHKICNLIKHDSEIGPFLTKAFEGLLLIGILDYFTNFFEMDNSAEFKHFISSLILRHLECIPFNVISFSDLSQNSANLVSFPFGTGIFPTISLINHSCAPNAIHLKHSKYLTTSVIAIRKLRAGEEILITYGPMYTRQRNIEKRRAELFKKYKFICQCKGCTGTWTASPNRDRFSAKETQQIESEFHKILESFNTKQSFEALTQSKEILVKHLDYLTANYEDNHNLVQVGQELLKKCFLYLRLVKDNCQL